MLGNCIELLKTLGLLTDAGAVADLDPLDNDTLRKLLDYYVQATERRSSVPQSTSGESAPGLVACRSSMSTSDAVEGIVASALVYRRTAIDDPIFGWACADDQATRASRESWGQSAVPKIDKETLRHKLRYLVSLSPLIDANIIDVVPLHLLHKAPEEKPITYSPDRFRSAVPSHLLEFVHERAIVGRVERAGDALVIHPHDREQPTAGIHVGFRGDRALGGMNIHVYHDMQWIGENPDGSHAIEFRARWDDPPSKAVYDAWVEQSINRTVADRLFRVGREVAFADSIGATYLTESEFEARICGMSSSSGGPIDAVNFLTANMPQLDLANADLAARLRLEYPQQFDRFQQSLQSVASELTGFSGDFAAKSQSLYKESILPEIEDLHAKMMKIVFSTTGAFAIASSTIALAILSGITLPMHAYAAIGLLSGIGQVPENVPEFLAKRRGPAFIWSKLHRAAK